MLIKILQIDSRKFFVVEQKFFWLFFRLMINIKYFAFVTFINFKQHRIQESKEKRRKIKKRKNLYWATLSVFFLSRCIYNKLFQANVKTIFKRHFFLFH